MDRWGDEWMVETKTWESSRRTENQMLREIEKDELNGQCPTSDGGMNEGTDGWFRE